MKYRVESKKVKGGIKYVVMNPVNEIVNNFHHDEIEKAQKQADILNIFYGRDTL